MKKLVLIGFLFTYVSIFAQAPVVSWQKSYGGTKAENLGGMCKGPNGSFYLMSETRSKNLDVSLNHDTNGVSSDVWIMNLDSMGNLLWQKSFGGYRLEAMLDAITTTRDGGIVFAVATTSNDGDVTSNHDTTGASYDAWIVKLNSSGAIVWEHSYGGSMEDVAVDIVETPDSGFIAVGWTKSHDGDVSFNHDTVAGTADGWVFKVNSSGILQWEKSYGGTGLLGEQFGSIIPTFDGNYFISGFASSSDGDCHGFHDDFSLTPKADTWLLKIDASGDTLWERCYGGKGTEDMAFISQLKDSSIIIAQRMWGSTDGDVVGNTLDPTNGNIWVFNIKMGVDTILWQKVTGGNAGDRPGAIFQKSNGNIVVYGYASVFGSGLDITDNHGGWDFWLYELNSEHKFVWKKSFGGSADELTPYGFLLNDSTYILAGSTTSNNGNISGNHGEYDVWFAKLEVPSFSAQQELASSSMSLKVFPNPSSGQVNLFLPFTNTEENEAQIVIRDVTGKEVFRTTRTQSEDIFISLNLTYLSRGFYILSYQTSTEILTTKLILE